VRISAQTFGTRSEFKMFTLGEGGDIETDLLQCSRGKGASDATTTRTK